MAGQLPLTAETLRMVPCFPYQQYPFNDSPSPMYVVPSSEAVAGESTTASSYSYVYPTSFSLTTGAVEGLGAPHEGKQRDADAGSSHSSSDASSEHDTHARFENDEGGFLLNMGGGRRSVDMASIPSTNSSILYAGTHAMWQYHGLGEFDGPAMNQSRRSLPNGIADAHALRDAVVAKTRSRYSWSSAASRSSLPRTSLGAGNIPSIPEAATPVGSMTAGSPHPQLQSMMDMTMNPSGEPLDCCPEPEHTTVMLQNIPGSYNRDMVIALLDNVGLKGSYNFLYLPLKFSTGSCLGYIFVNFVSIDAVRHCWKSFQGFTQWLVPSELACEVSLDTKHRGYDDLIERYRNSPIMHHTVADEAKPVVFYRGVRVPFPAPTKTLRVPRRRRPSHNQKHDRFEGGGGDGDED
mmetsp:Transcript_60694/g.112611  ORF Transcript_60694/g.112611 Transcript_60694/m.112611 type:complete len:407 (+) Transcript_60694:82-1302(+)